MAGAVAAWAAIALLGLAAPAGAQALVDPTRPPSVDARNGSAAAESGNPLEAVLISATRKAAIIDGRLVPLGGTYGGARLVEVTPTGVVLKSKQASRTLRLHPGVHKSPVKQTSEHPQGKGAPQEAR